MSYNHVVVWLDHKEAHVFHFDSESTRMEAIKTRSNQLHLHHKRGSVGSGKLGGNADYLREIMDSLSEDSPDKLVAFMKSSQVGGTECGSNC